MTATVKTPRDRGSSEPFERLAADVLGRLRATFSAVISAIPGSTQMSSAAQLERALGVRTTLAWQVYRLACADDPMAEVKNVPGVAAMGRFLKAALENGVAHRFVNAASLAVDDFKELVEVHAGNRRTFDSMASGLVGDGSDGIDLEHKRAAFMANSHLFGAQAKTKLACWIIRPSLEDAERLDYADIGGLIGLRMLRHNVQWVIESMRIRDDEGNLCVSTGVRPVAPEERYQEVNLLRPFCNDPLPRLQRSPGRAGWTNIVLESDGIGNSSASTYLIGSVYDSAVPRYRDERNEHGKFCTAVRTPCEVLVHDVLVCKGLFGTAQPRLRVYGDHRNVDASLANRECDIMSLSESVVYLGKGVSVLQTLDVPRYPEMAQFVFDNLGWDSTQFDVYRCRVQYPVMPSSVVVEFNLLEKPRSGRSGDSVLSE